MDRYHSYHAIAAVAVILVLDQTAVQEEVVRESTELSEDYKWNGPNGPRNMLRRLRRA
jgi:hypothetical protein